MKEIILILDKKDKEQLANLRCEDDLLVADHKEEVWIRGISTSDFLTSPTRLLPTLKTFTLDQEGYLFTVGAKTPTEKLQDLKWYSISQYCSVDLPTSAMPAKVKSLYEVTLVASQKARETSALLTTLKVFKEYAEAASEIRLKAIRFAVSEKDEVLIMGNPLPPIPGKEYWKEDKLLLPAGLEFEIPVVSKLIGGKINAGNSYLLFHTSGRYETIPPGEFVEGSRSAIRLTGGK